MAAYISAPRDFSKVKSKVAFNLTARQLVCFGAAAVVGVPLFFVLRDTAGNTGATLGMMAVMLPMFFLAMYQKNGQPAEKILMYYIWKHPKLMCVWVLHGSTPPSCSSS